MNSIVARQVINAIKRVWDVKVPKGLLQHSSPFLEKCNLTANSTLFDLGLKRRVATLRHTRALIVDASSKVSRSEADVFESVSLTDVLVALTVLIRANFRGKVAIDLSKENHKAWGIPADLMQGELIVPKSKGPLYWWDDSSLHHNYLMEIDKAVRILRYRGVSVETNLELPPTKAVVHRNQLLNSTPSIAPIPMRKVTLRNYSTDKPEFIGYDRTYPEPISYAFNSKGYRNDFEHDVRQEHSVLLGCSFAEGVGVPYPYTLSHQLTQKEGRQVLCLGCHGSGINYMFRSFSSYLAEEPRNPVSVYAVFTEIHRLDVFDKGFFISNGVFSTFSAWSDPKTMRFLTQVGVGYVYISAYLTYLFLKEHCLANGIRFSAAFYNYWNPSPVFFRNVYGEDVSDRLWGEKFVDFGRDRLHPGKTELKKLGGILAKEPN